VTAIPPTAAPVPTRKISDLPDDESMVVAKTII